MINITQRYTILYDHDERIGMHDKKENTILFQDTYMIVDRLNFYEKQVKDLDELINTHIVPELIFQDKIKNHIIIDKLNEILTRKEEP